MTQIKQPKVFTIPQQAETQITLTENGEVCIWQEGLGGSDDQTILIHPVFINLFFDAIKAAMSEAQTEA